MSDTSAARPFSDLRPTGLLWLINATVFHPRGYALALHQEDDGTWSGWSLLGDGTQPWHFTDPAKMDGHFAAANALFADTTASSTTPPINDRELDRLRSWKESASAVLAAWHELEALIPADFTATRLGMTWPQVVREYIDHLAASGVS